MFHLVSLSFANFPGGGACWLVCLGFCLCFVLACCFLASRGIPASN